MNKNVLKILKYSQVFFYLTFLSLWFKNNYPPLKQVNISFLIPLIPLLIITAIRLFLSLKIKRLKFQLRLNKILILFFLIIVLATAIRVPYLFHSYALMDSDDGVSSLIGKHISEGEPASIFFYGEAHEGTFSQHIYALIFRVFNYSVTVLKISTFLFFLFFLGLQFHIIRNIFSNGFALVISLFFCLPIGHIVLISLDTINSFPILLFFCSLIIYLTYLIYYKNREDLIPATGFLSGLMFWDHQVTISFALTSFIFIALRAKHRLKKYLEFIIYFIIGTFPIILFEIFNKFYLTNFLLSERRIGITFWEKIKGMVSIIISLLSHETHYLNYIYLYFILLGIGGIIYFSLVKKNFSPQNIYVIYFLTSTIIYLSSPFSNEGWVRYLYPHYFVLPILLLAIFYPIKKKIKYVYMIILILVLMVFSNLKGTCENFLLLQEADLNLKKTVNFMEETNNKYWVGEYWSAFLLTALSKENIVVFPYDYPPYYPYKLAYYNEGQNNNFVFVKEIGSFALRYKEDLEGISKWRMKELHQVNNLIRLLQKLNVAAKINRIGGSILAYDNEGDIFLPTTFAPIPDTIPEPTLKRIESSKVYLSLTFRTNITLKEAGFRLHIEVPGYSSTVKGFSPEKEEMKIRIPFPRRKSFSIMYYLDYMGIRIPSTVKELSFSPPARHLKRKKEIVYLSGFGPKVTVFDKQVRVCEKEVKFEINKKLRKESRIRLYLYSPFGFSNPYWYGEYFQEVKIYINGHYLTEKRLEDGENVIEFDMRGSRLKKRANIVTLKFKYHLPFRFAPFWKTAALLSKIEVE